MTMDENINTIQARKVHLNDDDNEDACHAPTTYNHTSNAKTSPTPPLSWSPFH
jgi:hypothetical protein